MKYGFNKDLFFKLIRKYKIVFPDVNERHSDIPHIDIDGRRYPIQGKKQFLKNIIFNRLESSDPKKYEEKNIIGITYKTIKEFLNSANKITKK